MAPPLRLFIVHFLVLCLVELKVRFYCHCLGELKVHCHCYFRFRHPLLKYPAVQQQYFHCSGGSGARLLDSRPLGRSRRLLRCLPENISITVGKNQVALHSILINKRMNAINDKLRYRDGGTGAPVNPAASL